MRFDDDDLPQLLAVALPDALDNVDFGIVGMRTADETVVVYNVAETRMTGLGRERVMGRRFFDDVAPCTNNVMVAERFRLEPDLDAVIDYVFTLRMRPSPVRLRLMRLRDAELMWLAVAWRP